MVGQAGRLHGIAESGEALATAGAGAAVDMGDVGVAGGDEVLGGQSAAQAVLTGVEDEDDIVVDDEDQRITITLDADSFLTQADLALDSTMLTWHYRSRYESLISYSNHAFYEARLATIPDRTHDAQQRHAIVAAAPDEAPVSGEGGEAVLRSLHPPRRVEFNEVSERRSAVAAEIAEQLRARGHDVDVSVGRSAFTVDVAIRTDGEYALGVMVDPGSEGASPTARMIAEAGVLDAMNWPISRVLITDWWNNPDHVLDRIEHLVRT